MAEGKWALVDNPFAQRMLDEVNHGLRVPQADTYIDNI
jgi:hypothetical protein